MRAAALRVRAEHVDDALDRLLPDAPFGVYERELGPFVELVFLGTDVPGAEQRELPDDPEQRLALLMDPPVVADRFVIRPPFAPPSGDPALEDIVIERGSAFGTGLHPTTRRCLELLLALEPSGSFADLGCGTGVLAIAAARLGWAPVVAVDYNDASVEAAAQNATANGVDVETRRVDLLAEPPPVAQTIVANVAVHVQSAVRASLAEPPAHLVLSGVTPVDADGLVAAYHPLGLVERRRFVDADWAAVLLTAPDVPLRDPQSRGGLRVRVPAGDAPVAAPPQTPLPTDLPGQLESRLPDGGFALSSARDLPTGARVATLLAAGMFRLDVRHLEDTLKVSLRNLSSAPIRSLPETGPPRTIVTTDDVTIVTPVATNARLRLRLGSGAATHDAEIILSALSGIEPGSGRVAVQAVIRPVST